MKTPTEPTPLEHARVLLAAASHVEPPLRDYYAAKARLAYVKAVAELEQLGRMLVAVEGEIGRTGNDA
jgi:hypothetical protein